MPALAALAAPLAAPGTVAALAARRSASPLCEGPHPTPASDLVRQAYDVSTADGPAKLSLSKSGVRLKYRFGGTKVPEPAPTPTPTLTRRSEV